MAETAPCLNPELTLQITNNTTYAQQAVLLANPYNLLDTANATTEYRWNVTGFVITNETEISIQYKLNSAASYTTYFNTFSGTDLNSVVAAMNSLGIGFFYLYTELGQTYISTYNDNYTFNGFSIYGVSITYIYDMTVQLANAALYNSSEMSFFASISGAVYTNFFYSNPSGTFTNIGQVLTGLNGWSITFGVFTNPYGNIISVTPPSNIIMANTISLTNIYYAQSFGDSVAGASGSLIYNAGYAINGVGPLALINISNLFWINKPPTNTNGHVNLNTLWNNGIPYSNQYIGYSFSYNSPTAKQVYIGISGDNNFKMYVNDILILDYDNTANEANILSILSVVSPNPAIDFFNIYPVNLIQGQNLLRFENASVSTNYGIGVEIYDNTAAEIAAATSYAGLNVLFQSHTLQGTFLF